MSSTSAGPNVTMPDVPPEKVFAASGFTVMLFEMPETDPWVPWVFAYVAVSCMVCASKRVMLAALFPVATPFAKVTVAG